MKHFVFRNNTIERFFSKEYSFSGYDDISLFPSDIENYVWWYQIPVKYDQNTLTEEVRGYIQKFSYVLGQIDMKKTFVALTIDVLYNVPLLDNDFQLNEAVSEYNSALYKAEKQYSNVKVIDIREFTCKYHPNELIDWKYYFISQMGMNPRLSHDFMKWFEQKLNSIALKRKKCLVLDLDNTLWGGILGEDGIEGIQIGGDYPGRAFLYWQEALLQLSKTGVILAICSKNNEQDVLEAWNKNPYIKLKKESFSAYRINWKDKASNIKEIAEELNIGLDSFVFVDDNPSERELVKQVLPMVEVPNFPKQPYMFPEFFKMLVENYFKVYSITDEDRKKTEQYKANIARVHAQSAFTDFDNFLESLDIKIEIESANDFNIQRIAQMTQKTNQFNLTTKRYTDADIKGFIEDGWHIWCLSVSDKFGDSGITGCIMVNGNEIDTFLLSCRILGKGIENVFIKKILSILADKGLNSIKASYLPTLKNSQVKNFYENCGFTCIYEAIDGTKNYLIDLAKANLEYKKFYNVLVN